MINDVKFNNEISAYQDWGIVLTNKEIGLPKPKTSTIDIKGGDGVLDLSTALTGSIKFNNRVIKLTFELLNLSNYTDLITNICNYLHGKVVTLVFSNDDNFFYKGRCTINQWQCSKNKGTIVINIDAEPYKLEVNSTIVKATVSGYKDIVLSNLRMNVCPILSVTGNVQMSYEGKNWTLDSGDDYYLLDFVLTEGNNKITLSGDGSVTFTYQKGAL